MKLRILISSIAVASSVAVALATPVFAQSASPVIGAADNTNSQTFPMWMQDQSMKSDGRLSRQVYMDEMGRRWDVTDRTNQGMTMADMTRTYGFAPHAAGTIGAADNTNSVSFPTWATQQAERTQGRMSRQAFMDETGRRWDVIDQTRQGLTMEDMNRAYGFAGTPGAPAAPGPGNLKK